MLLNFYHTFGQKKVEHKNSLFIHFSFVVPIVFFGLPTRHNNFFFQHGFLKSFATLSSFPPSSSHLLVLKGTAPYRLTSLPSSNIRVSFNNDTESHHVFFFFFFFFVIIIIIFS